MSFHFTPDLSPATGRPDIEVSLPEEPRQAFPRRAKRVAVAAGVFLGTTFAIAVVFFIPVIVFNLSRIEALEIAGRHIPVTQFADELGALFWGTFIVALAFTSFIASLLLFATGRIIRPHRKPVRTDDALVHLNVLRLSGAER
ncbi:MAG: hypothetical protein NXH99_05125 [Rhodobacteraceae bacterium]|nr:hypothetical protein [Paracoccaceae bacterium]